MLDGSPAVLDVAKFPIDGKNGTALLSAQGYLGAQLPVSALWARSVLFRSRLLTLCCTGRVRCGRRYWRGHCERAGGELLPVHPRYRRPLPVFARPFSEAPDQFAGPAVTRDARLPTGHCASSAVQRARGSVPATVICSRARCALPADT